jgi:hypothetical protein
MNKSAVPNLQVWNVFNKGMNLLLYLHVQGVHFLFVSVEILSVQKNF